MPGCPRGERWKLFSCEDIEAKKAAASLYLGSMGKKELPFDVMLLFICDATKALARFREGLLSGFKAGLFGFILPILRFMTRHFLEVM